MNRRYESAVGIWARRNPGGGREVRRDLGFIVYSAILLVMICLVPIIRLIFLSLTTPAATAVLNSHSAANAAGVVSVAACAVALWAGRYQGPAALPPFLTYALTGSDLPRYVVYRRSLLIGAVLVTCLLTSSAVMVALSMWATGTLSLAGAGLIIAAWFLIGLVAFCLWQLGQVYPRSSSFASVVLVVVGAMVWLDPSLVPFVPFAWPSLVHSGGPFAVAAVVGLVVTAAVGVSAVPRMLETLAHPELVERSIRLTQARAQIFVMEFGRASSMYRQSPRLLRKMRAVRSSRSIFVTIVRQDLLTPLRSPMRVVTGLACLAASGLLVGLATSLGPLSIVSGLIAGLLGYVGVGVFAEGVRLAADLASDLPLFGISDRAMVGGHMIVPAVVGLIFVGTGGAVGAGLVPGVSMGATAAGAAVLTVLNVAVVLMSAVKGPMPAQLLTSVPSPMGDPMVLTRTVWALDGPVAASCVGIAASTLVSAPWLAAIVAGTVGVVLVRRWVHRR